MRFALIFVLFVIRESTFVHSTSRSTSPKAVNLDEWSKLVEAPSDHNPLQYSSYSPPRPRTPPHKPVDLKEWSKLVEVPVEHKPLEYPSLDSPIKEHERVNKLPFPKVEPVKEVYQDKKRKRILESGINETHVPTRRAQLKAMVQTKTATNAHIAELEKIRNRERRYKQNFRSNKRKRLSEIVDPKKGA